METMVQWNAGWNAGGKVSIKKSNGDHGLVEHRGGKCKYRSRMETMVWWNAGGGNFK